MTTHIWNFQEIINTERNYAAIILNQKINCPKFKEIWKNAKIKICADGGLNRLNEYLLNNNCLDFKEYKYY